MANITVDGTGTYQLEEVIADESMVNQDNLYIRGGATVRVSQTPSILIGGINIYEGDLFIDGAAAETSGTTIEFTLESDHDVSAFYPGSVTVSSGWYDLATSDGSASQIISVTGYFASGRTDSILGCWVESGRRIPFQNASGTTPEVNDWLYSTSDPSGSMGRIKEVGADYLVTQYWINGPLASGDALEVRKIVDSSGDVLSKSWTCQASGPDVLATGFFTEYVNVYCNGQRCIDSFGTHLDGFCFLHAFASGSMEFGDGTNGIIPPTGARIRVPSVHLGQASITDYNAGDATAYTHVVHNEYNCAYNGSITVHGANAASVYFDGQYATSYDVQYVAGYRFNFQSNVQGCTAKHVIIPSENTANNNLTYLITCDANIGDVLCEDVHAQLGYFNQQDLLTMSGSSAITCRRSCLILSDYTSLTQAYQFPFVITGNAYGPITFDDFIMWGGGGFQATSPNGSYKNIKWNFQRGGVHDDKSGYGINFSINAADNYVANLMWLTADCPETRIFYLGTANSLKFRAIGFIDEKIPACIGGYSDSVFYQYSSVKDIDIARCWFTDTGATYGFILETTNCTRGKQINCAGDYDEPIDPAGTDTQIRGRHGGEGQLGSTSNGVYLTRNSTAGCHFIDYFRSDTTGAVTWCAYPTTTTSSPYFTEEGGNVVFSGQGYLTLEANSTGVWEMPYYARGHTSFTGVLTKSRYATADGADGAGFVTVEFQYNIESSGTWSGSWLDASTAAHLTSIGSEMVSGVKLKVRLSTGATEDEIAGIAFHTDTTLADQAANLHPIDQDETTITLSNVVVGSRYYIYNTDTSTLLTSGTASSSTVEYTSTGIPNGTTLLVRVRKSSAATKYLPYETQAIVASLAASVYVSQVEDTIAT